MLAWRQLLLTRTKTRLNLTMWRWKKVSPVGHLGAEFHPMVQMFSLGKEVLASHPIARAGTLSLVLREFQRLSLIYALNATAEESVCAKIEGGGFLPKSPVGQMVVTTPMKPVMPTLKIIRSMDARPPSAVKAGRFAATI